MRHVFFGLALLLTLALILPAALAVDPKDAKDKDAPSTKATTTKSTDKDQKSSYSEKKAKAGEPFVAKLVQFDSGKRDLTVQVTRKIPQENTGAAQNIANLQRQLVGNRDPNSIRSIYTQIAQQQQNLVTYKEDRKKLELTMTDDTKVRTQVLPVEYDDKGKVRKLTAKELKALKGPDSTLPGYTADFDSLKNNQSVKVYLVKAKSKKKDDAEEGKPKVAIIVIVAEPK